MNLQPLNLKNEVYRRITFKYWRVPLMDVNQLAGVDFFFTNRGDVVRCAFCGVEVVYWVQEDDAFKDHQRWSPSCEFVRVVCRKHAAPAQTSQQQPSSSYDVCGPCMEYTQTTSGQERWRYIFTFIYLYRPMCNCNSTLIFIAFAATKFKQHNALQWDGLLYPYYSSYHARLQSFTT